MSRHLPPRPNLDHLKKQAKDLLRHVQKRNPQWKLADALHAIAREYGFASWPKLKAHVDSLPLRTNQGVGAAVLSDHGRQIADADGENDRPSSFSKPSMSM